MKLLILSDEKGWDHILKEVEPAFDIWGINYELKYHQAHTFPWKYRTRSGRTIYSLAPWIMRRIRNQYPGYDAYHIHSSKFEIDGASGVFHKSLGEPYVTATFPSIEENSKPRFNEFTYRISQLLVHELCHMMYALEDIEDRTHYWQNEKDDLMSAVKETEPDDVAVGDPNQPKAIVIHHEGASNGFESVNDWHRQRGFPKSSLGYHIGYQWYYDGDKWHNGRYENEEGMHTLGGWNQKSIGVCFKGNYDLEEFTYYQELKDKVEDIESRWGELDLYTHRELWDIDCPGDNLQKAVETLRTVRRIKAIDSLSDVFKNLIIIFIEYAYK